MKREVVKELEYALIDIDVVKNRIDEIQDYNYDDDITDIKERINKVITTLKEML